MAGYEQMSYSFYVNNFYSGFYINYNPASIFHSWPSWSIPEELRCPGCEKSNLMEFYINNCLHQHGPRHDGVPAVPYVELT
jgi:hypothetical protein